MKKTIAIIAGGDSSEYVISIQSADQIKKWLDPEKYKAYTVIIKGKDWEVCGDDLCYLTINKNDFSFVQHGQKVTFDCALIAIHGTPGEDGKLQAYFDMMKLPYTSSNVLSSALTFNKDATKNHLWGTSVSLAKSVLVQKGDIISMHEIIEKLGLPVFVKPNEGGSSFGITKVKHKEELLLAIEKAYLESSQVIIEEFIKGDEITCGMMKTLDKDYILPLTEIVSKNDFFDYDAKYTASLVDEITPARISDELTEKCKAISSEVYDKLMCKGLVRIDYILRDSKFYFLEINTVPGMSENSIVPKMARTAGFEMSDLWDVVIEDCII
ncbi:MAG: D-alanine--D-alanine ligase [Bacteroidales bacterium]|nr:D-alanine--D-alanine ligase [Bacteroidales bacterium]MCF8457303.1 D-alanine--D-alanine ligase [Bacteroidales bacterium]